MNGKANERTFQGILISLINSLLEDNDAILFAHIRQEQNIGTKNKSRFADGLLTSKIDAQRIVLFELKNAVWDASNEELVQAAMFKAMQNGYKYFVTGTPRELIIWETFKEGVKMPDRKYKSFVISNIRNDNDVLTAHYTKDITPQLVAFLKTLSDIVHDQTTEIVWDSIDKYFVRKLSEYIMQASESSYNVMRDRITDESRFQKRLSDYLKSQDMFNISVNFTPTDAYNICQLANYLLYLKIIFYTHLQRDAPALNLKPLVIPERIEDLNDALRERFNDVLKHDFEKIFETTILDEFEFEATFIPELKRNVVEFETLDFAGLNADIIGSIYNTLIDNQEQHDRGQHFTNLNEVDIVNAFCINENTRFVMDSGCGAGTFLVRAYFFLKQYNPKFSHQNLLEHIWGVEIAPFPVFLSTMNLCLLDFKTLDNYPCIIHEDFLDVQNGFTQKRLFLNINNEFQIKRIDNRTSNVTIPIFDALVGNPPYIRQELIMRKAEWNKAADREWSLKKINQQSDLYVYYLMHSAAFLREGGRLGYVVASSWLDVAFGKGLQKFLLDNFKIVAVIDHQRKRSFETASVNTSILILEKCTGGDKRTARAANTVRFVRVYAAYEHLIGNSQDTDRFQNLNAFVQNIERTTKTTKTNDLHIIIENQKQLEENSTINGKYENGFWGAIYLRAPDIYFKIIRAAGNKFVPVHEVCDVKRGFTTGCNAFFYLRNDTQQAIDMDADKYKMVFGYPKAKHLHTWERHGWYYSEMDKNHHIIERVYIQPLFKTQSDADKLSVNINKLRAVVLMCNKDKKWLAKYKQAVLEYINIAESDRYKVHLVPSVAGRLLWYNLESAAVVGDFIFPSKIGEYYRLVDNREAKVFCDKVNYAITVKEKYDGFDDIIFALLNSIIFRYLIDLFARQMTGAQTLSDVDVSIVDRTLILNPILLENRIDEIRRIVYSIKNRDQYKLRGEVMETDKQRLDEIIFETIGLTKKEVAELHKTAVLYVAVREQKSKSVTGTKKKQVLSYDDALAFITERFPEITTWAYLIDTDTCKNIKIPAEKAKYPKSNDSSGFGFYKKEVHFIKSDKTKTILQFDTAEEIALFRFLNDTLEIKDVRIDMPTDAHECVMILEILKREYIKYYEQVSGMIKQHRIKANPISIYKDVVMR